MSSSGQPNRLLPNHSTTDPDSHLRELLRNKVEEETADSRTNDMSTETTQYRPVGSGIFRP